MYCRFAAAYAKIFGRVLINGSQTWQPNVERMRRAFLRNFGLPPQAVRRTAQL
jgi:hypothetical protein